MTEQKQEGRSLAVQLEERGVTPSQWHTLSKSLFPGAKPESVLLAVDYCRARKLDPMKKPCHIVPMRVKDARTGDWRWRDVILPGIYELRTTAQRTGEYMGHSKPEYGPEVAVFGVTAPEYCEMTVYRWNAAAKSRTEFPVRAYFREVCGTKKQDGNEVANDRWARAPVQMLTKVTESWGLREAFPDEIGGEHTVEEVQHYHEDDVVESTAEEVNAELGLTEDDDAQDSETAAA